MSSVRRTLDVLDLLARKAPLGLRAIADALELPATSVHRLLHELAAESVVERDSEGSWRLANRLMALVDLQLESLSFQRLARPFCETIAAAVGETVNINALSGDGCVCIDKVRGNEQMQLDWRVGSRGPLHCGGAAKAILAYLPESERQRICELPKSRFTQHTITTAGALQLELRKIRERGYAIDNQEVVIGVYCVAVPILDRGGRPVGAISISGPAPKAPGSQVMPLVRHLNEACAHVSGRLGYAGAWPPAFATANIGKEEINARLAAPMGQPI
jgi:DNA-binding IclR family transcriptional regulator